MKLSPKTLTLVQSIAQLAQRYLIVIGALLFGALAAFLILRASTIVVAEPSEEKLTEKMQTVSRPRISDENAAIIETLGTQNITIQSDIGSDRNNPFAE